MIKLGRVKFRIKDFKCEQMDLTPEELYLQELKEAKPVITLDENNHQGSCRFCWGNESTLENPCIVPCKCSGSVGFIHFECLKNWLGTKLQKKESDHLISMYWKTFECEICKQAYPYLFKVGGTVYKLVDVQQPTRSGHYLVMESLPLEKNTSRTIHILGFSEEKQTFNMGRGHESEVRVNDISVSRCHAIIKYQPDGMYIEDNRSKFGTLVLLKDSHPLELEHTSAVQIGRTVVSFTVRNTGVDKTALTELGAASAKIDKTQIFNIQSRSIASKAVESEGNQLFASGNHMSPPNDDEEMDLSA